MHFKEGRERRGIFESSIVYRHLKLCYEVSRERRFLISETILRCAGAYNDPLPFYSR